MRSIEDRIASIETRLDKIVDAINHNVKTARKMQQDNSKQLHDLEVRVRKIESQPKNPFGGNPFGTV